MSEDIERVLRVFFSWQSDLPRAGNTQAIRNALRRAAETIEASGEVRVDLLDAPRTSGARDVAADLAEQIRTCDVFVADVSIVQRNEGRAFPNPNVVFELGLAAAQVGWPRIVLLSNDAFGRPEDQPFDYRGRSIHSYRVREQHAAGDRRELELALTRELQTVLDHHPLRPRELEAGTEAAVRRARDVTQLRRYLSQVNRGVIDEHLQRGPDQRIADAVLLFDFATEVVEGAEFQLSDAEAEQAVRRFHAAWADTLAHGDVFRDTSNARLQIMGGHTPWPEERRRQQEASAALLEAYGALASAWPALTSLLHERYVELDLAETDAQSAGALRRAYSEDDDE